MPLLVAGEPIPCVHGLHASERLIDALDYVEDSTLLHRVRLSGQIVRSMNKCIATERTSLWEVKCTGILSQFSREYALEAIKVSGWKAQHVIVDYITTGRQDLREEAQNTAIAAAKLCAGGVR